jgi:hypothetical protein
MVLSIYYTDEVSQYCCTGMGLGRKLARNSLSQVESCSPIGAPQRTQLARLGLMFCERKRIFDVSKTTLVE